MLKHRRRGRRPACKEAQGNLAVSHALGNQLYTELQASKAAGARRKPVDAVPANFDLFGSRTGEAVLRASFARKTDGAGGAGPRRGHVQPGGGQGAGRPTPRRAAVGKAAGALRQPMRTLPANHVNPNTLLGSALQHTACCRSCTHGLRACFVVSAHMRAPSEGLFCLKTGSAGGGGL